MAEDTKQPDTDASKSADVSASADSEKNTKVEDAKARVAAAKDALTEKAAAVTPGAPAAPKPPVKKKEEGPKPTDASSHPLVQKLKKEFGEAIGEAQEFIGQLSVRVAREEKVDSCG